LRLPNERREIDEHVIAGQCVPRVFICGSGTKLLPLRFLFLYVALGLLVAGRRFWGWILVWEGIGGHLASQFIFYCSANYGDWPGHEQLLRV
jgi:hypothetical protein